MLDAEQRLAVEFADVLSRTPAVVDDDLRDRLASTFSPKQIVELTQLIAAENARARFNRAFGIEAEGYDRPPARADGR